MALMLLVAAGFNFALGQRRDGAILLGAAIPVLGVDVLLEARSRAALKKLAAAVAPRARVVRDGYEKQVPAEELVVGDLLVVGEGDIVHADAVVRWGANLALDESQLTGESEPQTKAPYEGPIGAIVDGRQRIYAASMVVAGHGLAETIATGERTRYGEIARLVAQSEEEPSPLKRKTYQMARRLLVFAIAVAASILLLQLARGTPPGDAFLYAISLAISAVPEEFPLVLTLFLSLGAYRLSRRGVLVRRLLSVETLGSTTVICLDKTGTLTRGTYGLEEHIGLMPDFPESALLETAALACEPRAADPLERAVLSHCGEHGIDVAGLHSRWRLVHDYPFDMAGKHMSHVWVHEEASGARQARIVAKGALEGILEHCAVTGEQRRRAEEAHAELASRGMRVLAVASRWSFEPQASARAGSADPKTPPELSIIGFTGNREQDEHGMRLYGLLGFRDPLRAEVPAAVGECQAAGIRLKLVTGDHALTAHAVAEAAGIAHDDQEIWAGAALDALTTDDLCRVAGQTAIFARVQPEQKYAIVGALKRAGEVVAMTGDGVNDAPALRRADIGVSMGERGTEVARAAAGLVLLRDDFRALVATIREGRRVFANIQHAFSYLVGFKTMVIGLALLAPLIGLPPLLLLVELVWLELVVHPITALIFEALPEEPEVMRRPPRPPSSPILPAPVAIRSIVCGGLLMAGALLFYWWRLRLGLPYARGAAMAVVISGCLALAWAELAGERPWWTVAWPGNMRFWLVSVLVAGSLPAAMFVPKVSEVLQIREIAPLDWAIALLIVVIALGWRVLGIGPRVASGPGWPKPSPAGATRAG